jgi:hypothetical protein
LTLSRGDETFGHAQCVARAAAPQVVIAERQQEVGVVRFQPLGRLECLRGLVLPASCWSSSPRL